MFNRFKLWLQNAVAWQQKPIRPGTANPYAAPPSPHERYEAMAGELGRLALEWADACELAEGQMTQMTLWGMQCAAHGTKMPNLVLTLSAHPHTAGAPMVEGETMQ